MRKLKILYIAPEIIVPGTHGGSSHVEGIMTSLQSMGHRCILISRWEPHLKFIEKRDYYHIIRLPIAEIPGIKTILLFIFPVAVMLFIVTFSSVDLVWERARPFGGAAILLSHFFRKQTVYELNEPIESFCWKNKIIHAAAERVGLFVARHARVVTGTESSFFKHLPSSQCVVVDYGASPSLFNPSVDSSHLFKEFSIIKGKVVLYSGSFAPWHALPQILDAANIVIAEDPSVTFLLVGEGEQYYHIKKLVSYLHLDKNVFMLGKVPYVRMPEFVNAATITLALFDRTHPLFKEHHYFYSPLKIHEYKASSKPIVASDFGNLRKYIVNGQNGYLVNESNPKEVASAILKLIRSKKLSARIGRINRREVMTTYNWERSTQKVLESVYGTT